MKLSELSQSRIEQIALENNLKSGAMKTLLGDADLNDAGEIGVGVSVRAHLSEIHGAEVVNEIERDASDAARAHQAEKYGHVFPAMGGGRAPDAPDPIRAASDRKYAHVLENLSPASKSVPTAGRYAHVLDANRGGK